MNHKNSFLKFISELSRSLLITLQTRWSLTLLFGLLFSLSLLLGFSGQLMAGGSVDRTMAIFQDIPGATQEQIEKGRQLITDLDYFHMRVFRALCKLENASADAAIKIIPELSKTEITFYHLDLRSSIHYLLLLKCYYK